MPRCGCETTYLRPSGRCTPPRGLLHGWCPSSSLQYAYGTLPTMTNELLDDTNRLQSAMPDAVWTWVLGLEAHAGFVCTYKYPYDCRTI